MKLRIVNRSKWPDWFVKPVATWIAKRVGVPDGYELTLASFRRMDCFAGSGGSRGSRIRINRRMAVPHDARYQRYKYAPVTKLNTRSEAFVFIVAHEMCHATKGHPKHFTRMGRTDESQMEMTCELFARECVEAFRAQWRLLFADARYMARKMRNRQSLVRSRRAEKRQDPSPKLEAARAAMRRWEAKAKLAKTKISKYRKRVRYYEGRMAARAATVPAPNTASAFSAGQ